MEYTSDEIFQILESKSQYFKSPEEMAPIIKMLFKNPEVINFFYIQDPNLKNKWTLQQKHIK